MDLRTYPGFQERRTGVPSPANLLMAIDVGNTHITIGIFRGKSLLRTWRLHSNRQATADELGLRLVGLLDQATRQGDRVQGVVVASVVPTLDGPLDHACLQYLHQKPLNVMAPGVRLGIDNRYKKPEEVGADRLVNAAAVRFLYRKAAIIVDFGTATTFDCLSAKGDYLGGAICPGIDMAGEALASKTAKLPRVAFREAPPEALGRTTQESLQSGLFWGYIGLAEGLLKRLQREMGGSPMTIITGGLAPVIGPHLAKSALILPDLTLEGLRLIWEKNAHP